MPVSDYLISLALALYPHGDAKLPLTLGADAVSQPDGGAAMFMLESTDKHRDPIGKTATVAPQKCASGEHFPKTAATGEHFPKATADTRTGHIKGSTETAATVNACANGKHLEKW